MILRSCHARLVVIWKFVELVNQPLSWDLRGRYKVSYPMSLPKCHVFDGYVYCDQEISYLPLTSFYSIRINISLNGCTHVAAC